MKFAPLTGFLLVAKGAARPTLVASGGPNAAPLAASALPRHAEPRSARVNVAGRPARALSLEAVAALPQQRPEPDAAKRPVVPHERVRISIRLTPDDHQRLRLAALKTRRSLQDIVTGALDAYLETLAPELRAGACACFRSVTSHAD
ncbi:MAG TPA: hypothetical protein VJN41_02460 [Alphaproteobacteria bacterium]|nr:hypothetical protein [Alphaproteobacteria bacterium]